MRNVARTDGKNYGVILFNDSELQVKSTMDRNNKQIEKRFS